jgi:hypothetical protein
VVDDQFPPSQFQMTASSLEHHALSAKPEVTLTPGVYRGGIFSGGARRVVLRPGVYIFEDGDFLRFGAQLEGEGVTLCLAAAWPGAFWTCGQYPTQSVRRRTVGAFWQGLLIVSRRRQATTISASTGTQGTLNGVILCRPHRKWAVGAAAKFMFGAWCGANLSLTPCFDDGSHWRRCAPKTANHKDGWTRFIDEYSQN